MIAAKVFLTVAHCIDVVENAGQPLFVSFGTAYDEDAASPSGLFSGSAIKHPLWGTSQTSDPHDMAVVLLDSAPGIAPAALPTAGLLDQLARDHRLKNQGFTTVGYGVVRNDKKGGPHALEGRDGMRRYASESFQSLRPALLALSQNPSTGDGGTCRGDSGGPHFLGGVTSNLVVATTLDTDTSCRASGTAYRLDTPSARNFLAQFVASP